MYATTRSVSHGKFSLERIDAGKSTPSPDLIPPAPDVTLAMEKNLVAQKQQRRGGPGKWEYQKAKRPPEGPFVSSSGSVGVFRHPPTLPCSLIPNGFLISRATNQPRSAAQSSSA